MAQFPTPPILNALSDSQLVDLLLEGGVGIIPTDTVYGLVCRATDPVAVERLYTLKHRDHKPGTIIAASIEQLTELGLKARYLKAVEQYWPGPVSVIIPTLELSYLHQGLNSLAVRVTSLEILNKLIISTGPLLTTSANEPSEPPATTVQEAVAYFDNKVDFYVNGGDLAGQEASTVIRIVDDAIEVLRQGAVKIDETGRITT